MRKSKYTIFLMGPCIVLLCLACNSNTVFSDYQHVPLGGWERNDTLTFAVSPIQQGGSYQEEVGIRINGTFPFTGLELIIDQTVFPSHEITHDTLNCNLINQDGSPTGQGISHYQYKYPLNTLSLQEGDSLSIRIRHNMKREILPGIANIGIMLTRK